jgi:predicted DNA-binding transcriptional regulator YafY
MSDTLLRQLAMLRKLPRYPRKIATIALKESLLAEGFEIDLRTIQRDLNKLSEVLPLVSDNAKPQGWSWQAHVKPLDMPALDLQTALTFSLVQSHLQSLLPSATLDYLAPWFNTAHGVLDKFGNGLAKWPDKIRVLPRGIPQQAPSIEPATQDAVYQAVLQERQLEIVYQRNSGNLTKQPPPKAHIVNPLALVVRDKVIYLVSTFDGFTDVRQLALHRIQSAKVCTEEISRPKGFSIDKYIEQGEFNIPIKPKPIQLVLEFYANLAIHLSESPIAADQIITTIDDETVGLTATVFDTFELRVWLKGFGDEVEVMAPAELRQEFETMAQSMYDIYMG